MKKSIFILVMSAFLVGSLGTGCKNSEKEAQEKLQDATHEEQQDTRIKIEENKSEINEAEWDSFKNDIDAKMKANEILVNDLKSETKKPGKKHDAAYLKSVDTLEKKNIELQEKINNYDKNQSDWDNFKSGIKNDMDALGKELHDLKTGKKK